MIFIFKYNVSQIVKLWDTSHRERNCPFTNKDGERRSREASGSRGAPENQLFQDGRKNEYVTVLRTVGSGEPTHHYPQKEPVCVRMSL